jgi:N-acetylglucosamine kinase-like BadF-type ATPase
MNILIESGATKSTCIGYNDKCTFFSYKTIGINATYATKGTILAIFREMILENKVMVEEVQSIRYDGAGCFNKTNAEKVKEVLTSLFQNANIEVFSDLYAACHALCKNSNGFVGILGTGAASCFYNGATITRQAPSLGWLLGDEGSGTHLGKLFVIEYLKDKLELEIIEDFEAAFSVSKSIVFEKIYQNSNSRTFFASIPPFLLKHIENQQIRKLVETSFQDFFDKQIDYYKTYPHPWYFCGSIAFYFQEISIEVAKKNNIEIAQIIPEAAPLITIH